MARRGRRVLAIDNDLDPNLAARGPRGIRWLVRVDAEGSQSAISAGESLYTALYMAATRTQIYLTPEQRERLDAIRGRDGRSLAAVVRDAVDQYVGSSSAESVQEALDATYGTMSDVEVPSRDEWDRGYG